MARKRKTPSDIADGMTGKKLTQLLRDSGTGESKLAVCRAVLVKKPTASAEAVLDALRDAAEQGLIGDGTVAKAEQIARDGEYTGPVQPETETPVEDLTDGDEEADEPAPKPKAKPVVQGTKDSPCVDFKPTNFVETPKAEKK